jgi:hypothetical protein
MSRYKTPLMGRSRPFNRNSMRKMLSSSIDQILLHITKSRHGVFCVKFSGLFNNICHFTRKRITLVTLYKKVLFNFNIRITSQPDDPPKNFKKRKHLSFCLECENIEKKFLRKTPKIFTPEKTVFHLDRSICEYVTARLFLRTEVLYSYIKQS